MTANVAQAFSLQSRDFPGTSAQYTANKGTAAPRFFAAGDAPGRHRPLLVSTRVPTSRDAAGRSACATFWLIHFPRSAPITRGPQSLVPGEGHARLTIVPYGTACDADF